MKLQVTFDKPWDVSSGKSDGPTLRFPFRVRRISEDARRDVISDHFIDVEIGVFLMGNWGFKEKSDAVNNPSFVKSFFEIARKEVGSKLRSGEFRDCYTIVLHSHNTPEKNPYDPAKIPVPEGFSFEIELGEK